MDHQLTTIDQENIPDLHNRPRRRTLYKPLPLTSRPVTSEPEPPSHPQTQSIPWLLPPQPCHQPHPRIIARHHKLRDFFTINQEEKGEGKGLNRRRSIDVATLHGKRVERERVVEMHRKLAYKRLYLQQKERYEALLRKYGVEERVDDSEF